eukprot:6474529-Amphidinium_carterae.3
MGEQGIRYAVSTSGDSGFPTVVAAEKTLYGTLVAGWIPQKYLRVTLTKARFIRLQLSVWMPLSSSGSRYLAGAPCK